MGLNSCHSVIYIGSKQFLLYLRIVVPRGTRLILTDMNTQYYKGSLIEVYGTSRARDGFIASVDGCFFSRLTFAYSAEECLAKAKAIIENQLFTSNL